MKTFTITLNESELTLLRRIWNEAAEQELLADMCAEEQDVETAAEDLGNIAAAIWDATEMEPVTIKAAVKAAMDEWKQNGIDFDEAQESAEALLHEAVEEWADTQTESEG